MNDVAQNLLQRNRAATRVLAALLVHGRRGKAGIKPDLPWLEGLLSYVDQTVRSLHFVAEESALARPLEQVRPDLKAKIARLRRDHIAAGGYCHRLKEALGFWNTGWGDGLEMYLRNASDTHRLGVSHGRLLRGALLPAAEAAFSPAQWQALAQALAARPDPLAGCATRAEFDAALARMMGRPVPASDAAASMPVARAPGVGAGMNAR
jgi:hemerythrin-like domain-containing protein